jgi:hypothetical protein
MNQYGTPPETADAILIPARSAIGRRASKFRRIPALATDPLPSGQVLSQQIRGSKELLKTKNTGHGRGGAI